VAPSFVRGFLGEQWLPMITVMRILALWGLIRSIGANIGPVFKSLGRPDIETKIQGLKVAIIVVTIYPITARWGLEGAAAVIVGSSMFVTSPLGNYLAVKQIDGSIIRFIKTIIYPLSASSVMISILYFIDSVVGFKSAILEVVVYVLAGVIIYSLSIFFITRFFKYPILEDINKILKSIV